MASQLKVVTYLVIFGLFLFCPTGATAALRKILYVDSYHESYPWSAGITRGIETVLTEQTDIELKILRMDSKRKSSEQDKRAAALKIKDFIGTWQPDLVITSDDNAAKYLIAPYFKNSPIPFVFCGINWDAANYGLPVANVTGMLEVQLIEQILKTLKQYTSGTRIAFLKGDDLSARKEADFFEQRFSLQLDKRFVANFSAWKTQYRSLQNEADMLLLGNNASIKGWNNDEAREFVLENTRIPSGNWDDWMAFYSLVTFANRPEEQGEWAARTALKILAGTAPADIPMTHNQKGKIYLNLELAKKMGIKFPIELIQRATFTSELSQ